MVVAVGTDETGREREGVKNGEEDWSGNFEAIRSLTAASDKITNSSSFAQDYFEEQAKARNKIQYGLPCRIAGELQPGRHLLVGVEKNPTTFLLMWQMPNTWICI